MKACQNLEDVPSGRGGPRAVSAAERFAGVMAAWLVWLGVLAASGVVGRGAAPVPVSAVREESAFNAAARSFQGSFYDRADRELGAFIQAFPASERLGEALLLQAQARFQLKKYDEVIALLSPRLAPPGKGTDKYRFWLAEAHFQRGDYPSATAAYAQLVKDFPDSSLRSEACFGEAMSWFKLGNLTNAVQLLRQPDGVFQKVAQASPNDPSVVRGYLLLGESLLLQQEYRAAEETLNLLVNRSLPPELDWQRQYLLVRVQLADLRPEAALKSVTNLLALTVSAGLPAWQPQAVALHGEVLQKAGQPAAAIQAYELNLAEGLEAEQRRQALLKIIELNLAQNQVTQAVQRLEIFLADHPKDPLLDLTHFTLGELRLRGFYGSRTNPPLQTNLLQQAQADFDRVISAYTNSSLLGKAYLNRGWCLWEAQKIPASLVAFTNAVARLPASEAQATAWLKAADARYAMRDLAGAREEYRRLLAAYAAFKGLPSSIPETALAQVVALSVELNDWAGATETLTQLLSRFPGGQWAERSLLRVGQLQNRLGHPIEARQLYTNFVQRFPNSTLLPEVQMALARTWVTESNWPAALESYRVWIEHNTNHADVAQAEFDRAWIYDQAHQETNAFGWFTNFVGRFPRHRLKLVAQQWVGDYYFRRGDYVKAEENYQRLYQQTNWPASELTYQARMMAGQAAFARVSFEDAKKYFTTLINLLIADTNSPPALLPEAWFRLGDTYVELAPRDATNALSRFGEAINAFSKIPETHRLAPVAWGRIADCNFQLASQEPPDLARLTNALSFYTNSMTSPLADVRVRSLAEIGLATVLEWQAQLAVTPPDQKAALVDQALQHYLNVVFEKNLNAEKGERPDAFALQKAGLEAARLVEAQKNWDQALKLYQELLNSLPALRPTLEKKISAVEAQRKKLP
jgi:TolA-binding protein